MARTNMSKCPFIWIVFYFRIPPMEWGEPVEWGKPVEWGELVELVEQLERVERVEQVEAGKRSQY